MSKFNDLSYIECKYVIGTPYDMGKAHGQLMNTRVVKFIDNVWRYLEEQVVRKIKN
jgi:hypothetical protein